MRIRLLQGTLLRAGTPTLIRLPAPLYLSRCARQTDAQCTSVSVEHIDKRGLYMNGGIVTSVARNKGEGTKGAFKNVSPFVPLRTFARNNLVCTGFGAKDISLLRVLYWARVRITLNCSDERLLVRIMHDSGARFVSQ